MSAKSIRFFKAKGDYGCFSNFAPYPIQLDGTVWPTTEHYFQAQKFLAADHREAIRAVPSPMIAARMGRSRSRPLRADWESIKEAAMYRALLAKFTQYPELKSQLLATGDVELIEHTTRDSYWGDGGDGKGCNRLGQLLMQVRAELRQGLHT